MKKKKKCWNAHLHTIGSLTSPHISLHTKNHTFFLFFLHPHRTAIAISTRTIKNTLTRSAPLYYCTDATVLRVDVLYVILLPVSMLKAAYNPQHFIIRDLSIINKNGKGSRSVISVRLKP